jgi:hypothetical protein
MGKYFKIDFCRLKIQFVELDFYNLNFQKSSTDQHGEWVAQLQGNYCIRIPTFQVAKQASTKQYFLISKI